MTATAKTARATGPDNLPTKKVDVSSSVSGEWFLILLTFHLNMRMVYQ